MYEVAVRTPAAASAAAYATIHTPAGAKARIREIGAFTSAATLSPIGLGRPANTPVATTSVLGQALDPLLGASLNNVDTAWSTAPTAPTQFFKRIALPATAAVGVIWAWSAEAPLIVPVSAWVVLWNFGGSTAAALDVYIKWEE